MRVKKLVRNKKNSGLVEERFPLYLRDEDYGEKINSLVGVGLGELQEKITVFFSLEFRKVDRWRYS